MASSGKGSAARFTSKWSEREPGPYERIKVAILSGEIAPSQPLVEVQLAAWCNVSRTPIREALTRLEQDRLVVRAESGLVVRERSPEEVLDIYETRVVLETAAARFAAERRTAHEVALLRGMLPKMDGLADAEPAVKATANAEFHRGIWRASRNDSLIDLLERLGMHLGRYPATTLVYPGRWKSANIEHARLLDAIEARDSSLAGDVATAHFTSARDIRLRLFSGD